MALAFPDISKRILKSYSTSRFCNAKTVPHSQPSLSPQHYKHWNEESVAQASKLTENEGKSFRAAAEMCGILFSTLHDHVSGKVDPFSKAGPNPYLFPKEEV